MMSNLNFKNLVILLVQVSLVSNFAYANPVSPSKRLLIPLRSSFGLLLSKAPGTFKSPKTSLGVQGLHRSSFGSKKALLGGNSFRTFGTNSLPYFDNAKPIYPELWEQLARRTRRKVAVATFLSAVIGAYLYTMPDKIPATDVSEPESTLAEHLGLLIELLQDLSGFESPETVEKHRLTRQFYWEEATSDIHYENLKARENPLLNPEIKAEFKSVRSELKSRNYEKFGEDCNRVYDLLELIAHYRGQANSVQDQKILELLSDYAQWFSQYKDMSDRGNRDIAGARLEDVKEFTKKTSKVKLKAVELLSEILKDDDVELFRFLFENTVGNGSNYRKKVTQKLEDLYVGSSMKNEISQFLVESLKNENMKLRFLAESLLEKYAPDELLKLPNGEGRYFTEKQIQDWTMTDPRHHNPEKFQYIVHGVDPLTWGRSYYPTTVFEDPYGFIARKYICTSVISQDHSTTFRDEGVILKVPMNNIIVGSSTDSGTNGFYIRKSRFPEVEQLFEGTRHNELVVYGTNPVSREQIEIVGVFVNKEDGSYWAKNLSRIMGIPLINLHKPLTRPE